MRTAVTVAKKHSGEWVMLGHPDTPLAEQNKTYRGFLLEKVHPDYCYVQLQESDGLFRRTHLRTPDAHAGHSAQLDKQNKDAEEAGKAEIANSDKTKKQQADFRAAQHQEELDGLNKQIEADNQSRAARKAPATAAEAPQKPATPTAPKAGGPTIEDWTEAGYNPVAYPPEGFSEVASDGLTEYKATGKLTPRAAHVIPIIQAAGSTTKAAAQVEAAASNQSPSEAPKAEGENTTAPATAAEAKAE